MFVSMPALFVAWRAGVRTSFIIGLYLYIGCEPLFECIAYNTIRFQLKCKSLHVIPSLFLEVGVMKVKVDKIELSTSQIVLGSQQLCEIANWKSHA